MRAVGPLGNRRDGWPAEATLMGRPVQWPPWEIRNRYCLAGEASGSRRGPGYEKTVVGRHAYQPGTSSIGVSIPGWDPDW